MLLIMNYSEKGGHIRKIILEINSTDKLTFKIHNNIFFVPFAIIIPCVFDVNDNWKHIFVYKTQT